MNCRETQRELAAYLDGELDKRAAAEVERHLRQCPGCRTEAEGLAERIGLLRSTPQPAAPAYIWTRIRQAVRAPRPVMRLAPTLRVALPAAAAVLVAVAAGFGIPRVRSWLRVAAPAERPPVVAPGPDMTIVTPFPPDLIKRIRTEDDVLRHYLKAKEFATTAGLDAPGSKRMKDNAVGLSKMIEQAIAENGIKISPETRSKLDELNESLMSP
jgi:hypothetical protein